MKKIITLLVIIMAVLANGADYKPFVFGPPIGQDSAAQQNEFDYMLQYKLYGRDYLKVGNDVSIPDKSGWNGTAGYMTSNARLELGGPVLVVGDISFGDQQTLTTGPVRANSMKMGNDNGSFITGKVCLTNSNAPAPLPSIISRSGGQLLAATDTACSEVPAAPENLSMPTIEFPDTASINITVPDRGKVFVDIPDTSNYDLYINSIRTGTEDTLYFRMANRGTLTRIFVKDEIVLGNHTVLQTFYGDSAVPQDKYRGNLLFYTQKDFNLVNSDNGKGALQGTFISTQKIYFQSNIKFAGQLLANQLELGNTFDGKNFRYVKFDPDTLDFPELNKQGGLRENDSTVIIPIQLSDTSTIDVYFTYCFELKNGVTIDDFNIPPYLPICGDSSITTKIPIGGKTPLDTIKINVKVDTLTEPNDILVMHIDSITGAVLPNGETSGELTIKIIDAPNSHVTFDTTAVYKFEENKVGVVDLIKVLNKTDSTKFILDSAYTGRYTLDEKTGELKLIASPLDYEASTVDMIKVTLKDTGDVSVTRLIPVGVIDVNEAPSINDTTFTLFENVPVPAIIGTVKVIDPDKTTNFRQNVFTLVEGNSNFAIDPTTGRITSTKIFDFENDSTEYKLKVKVSDKNDPTLCDSAIVTIKIGNTNEGPKFNAEDTTIYVLENTKPGVIDSIAATDDDGDKITYKIVETSVPFTVDSTGKISSTREFDYEEETGFVIHLVATDGTLSDTIKINVKVVNVNEPVHVNDTALTVAEKYVGPIGQVEGKDDDRQPVSYSISDSVHYSIDSLAGVISVIKPFDYKTQKTDTVEVIVTDGTFYDTAKVVVTIKNVNDPPILQPNDSLTVPENCKSCIVGIITATDEDDDPIKYTVKEPGFTIDSNGVLKLTDPLDYEKTPVVTITVIASDPSGAADTAKYTIKVTDINEPVHTKDTTCSVAENMTGKTGCKIEGKDEDEKPVKYIITDTTRYSIDSTGEITVKIPFDYEEKTKDTVKVIVTDGEFADTATVIINVKDELEKVTITDFDDRPKVDTIKTNNPDHHGNYKICEGDKCEPGVIDVTTHKDTLVKVCNAKKTSCDSVMILFNDAPPVITLVNAKSTDALIDYITIEEEKDDKVYVNKKENDLKVIVKDTVHNTKTEFPITVKLDTLKKVSDAIKEYNYVLDETTAQFTNIGGGLIEAKEVINGVTITVLLDAKTHKRIDSVQTVTYTKKIDGKDITVSYKTDDMTGLRVSDYEVSYQIDSATTVSYKLDDKKKIVKNKEGNIAYTVKYDYTDDFGNRASAEIEIVFDDIPPKVEILKPTGMESFNTNAIAVKWTVNGETQDTLTLQRLEKGVNYIIRRYVDKAGNVAADTVTVIMKEAKDIDIHLVHPVTEVDQDKVDEFYADHKYDPAKPYTVQTVDPKDNKLPETIGVGLKVDIALPSVSATGGLATLDDIVKNGMIPVDDKGNIVGASTKGIPVDEYVEQHCTDEFKEDYKKNGLNIPLYDVTYDLHLWIYTTTASYVNDFKVSYTLNDQDEATEAGTVQMVIDWLADKDGNVKAKNHHALGTGSYITKLYSKSVAKHRCDYKQQIKGDRTVKKEENMKIFGYKRPKK